MRGTRKFRTIERTEERFIPAYAGNTSSESDSILARPVHPRVCGEHAYRRLAHSDNPGSSPRMRGTPGSTSFTAPPGRFIPAYAGNTVQIFGKRVLAAVHPRVCGEHVELSSGFDSSAGSSPRMRGTRAPVWRPLVMFRFIPAYAGNTPGLSECREIQTVHPRVCGEHGSAHASSLTVPGSSPRMRGTQSMPVFG